MQRCYCVLFAFVISIILGTCLPSPLMAASLTMTDDGITPDAGQQLLEAVENPEKSLESQADEISLLYTAGALWQGSNAACGHGDYLYSYDYPGLQVIDLSNPDAPRIISRYFLPARARDMIYDDGFVYVAANYGDGLLIFDVTDPYAPVLASATQDYANLSFEGWSLDLVNDTVYMSAQDDIVIVDVADPYSPEVVSILQSAGSAISEAILDHHIYTASIDFVEGWDLSDLSSPVFLGTVACGDVPRGIAASGNLLYVASFRDGLYILDASAGLPTQIGRFEDTTPPWDRVDIAGNYAYLQCSGIIDIIDIETPSAPALVGNLTIDGFSPDTYFSGNKAYIADWFNGVTRYDLSSPAAPFVDVEYIAPGKGRELAVSGDFAYETSGLKGLRVLDLSDPESPEVIASYDTPGEAWTVATAGNAVYLCDTTAGLMIFDVADPHAPAHVGTVPVPYPVRDIDVAGSYAYTIGDDTMRAFDISDPLNPVQIGSIDMPWARYLAVQGNYAYVSSNSYDVKIVDVSDPTALSIVGVCHLSDRSWGLTLNGQYLYTFTGTSGDLKIVDVSDPADPTVAAEIPNLLIGTAMPFKMQVVGDYLYVAAYPLALRVLNISNPLNPYPAGSFSPYPVYPMDVDVAGDYVYLTGDNGFFVLRQARCNGPDGTGGFNISDAVYLIKYIFAGGPAPNPLETGDLNCDGTINLGDAVHMVDFIFRGGEPPCGGCY